MRYHQPEVLIAGSAVELIQTTVYSDKFQPISDSDANNISCYPCEADE